MHDKKPPSGMSKPPCGPKGTHKIVGHDAMVKSGLPLKGKSKVKR